MKVAELVARAKSVVGKSIRYRMGAGGMLPDAPTPAGVDGYCDCSGFLSWLMRKCRNTKDPFYLRTNGGWLNTDAMVADGNHPGGFLTRIARPKVGCFVIYPKNSRSSSGALRNVGHCGLVTAVAFDGVIVEVIHCSSGNDRVWGKAIMATPAVVFATDKTVYVWWNELEA